MSGERDLLVNLSGATIGATNDVGPFGLPLSIWVFDLRVVFDGLTQVQVVFRMEDPDGNPGDYVQPGETNPTILPLITLTSQGSKRIAMPWGRNSTGSGPTFPYFGGGPTTIRVTTTGTAGAGSIVKLWGQRALGWPAVG